MRKAILLTIMSASLVACQQSDPKLEAKLEEIGKKLDAIEKKVASSGAPAARRPQPPNRPRPGRPDPATTYAVPQGQDSPYDGPAHALVTIVEAYEYA